MILFQNRNFSAAALLVGALLVVPRTVHAQGGDTAKSAARGPAAAGAPTDSARTTLSRVFTADQAAKGNEVYLLACVSCHSPADHTGGGFWKDALGKTVAELFSYLRNNMPQDNVGSISEDDYVNVTAYILGLNAMPAGDTPLMRDSTQQARIRIAPLNTPKSPVAPPAPTRKGSRK